MTSCRISAHNLEQHVYPRASAAGIVVNLDVRIVSPGAELLVLGGEGLVRSSVCACFSDMNGTVTLSYLVGSKCRVLTCTEPPM